MALITRTGSRVMVEPPRPAWEAEWREASVADAAEQREARARSVGVALLALVASAAAGILALTPGFAGSDVLAAAIACAVVAALTVAVVPAAARAGGVGERLGVLAALASAGAAAIHFAVAKMHFDEDALFGVFFVLSGIAQFVWPVWWLRRGWRPLLVLGAVGNALIVALWAVDRIWGLPIGPEHWQPDPFGFGDTVASAFELVVVGACAALLARGRTAPLRGRALAVVVVTAFVLTTLALMSTLGTAPSLLPPAM